MAVLMNGIRLYLRYIGISIKSQMQYKGSFFMQTIGHLLITGLEFFGVWALFDRFGSLPNWRLEEVAFFYGMVNIQFAFADALARGFDMFAGFVKQGDFDRLLVRPRSTVVQLMGHELTLRRIGRLAQGAAVLGWSLSVLPIDWSVPLVLLCVFAFYRSVGICKNHLFFAPWKT